MAGGLGNREGAPNEDMKNVKREKVRDISESADSSQVLLNNKREDHDRIKKALSAPFQWG